VEGDFRTRLVVGTVGGVPTTWVTVDDALGAVLAAALAGGPAAPDEPGDLATMVAIATAPAYETLVGLAGAEELEQLRHVSLRLALHRPARAGERVRVDTDERERGRLGAAPGVLLVSRVSVDDVALATSEGCAQLGASAVLPPGAGALPVPRAVRVDEPTTVVDDAIGDDAVAAWLGHTGDEVPIHRDHHPLREQLGGVAVPGALLAARIAHRVGPLVPDATGFALRFKRLVPSGAPLRYLVAVEAGAARVAVVDAAGTPLASGTLTP
jgi:hypothetical protein